MKLENGLKVPNDFDICVKVPHEVDRYGIVTQKLDDFQKYLLELMQNSIISIVLFIYYTHNNECSFLNSIIVKSELYLTLN